MAYLVEIFSILNELNGSIQHVKNVGEFNKIGCYIVSGNNVSNGDLGFSPSDGIPALQYFEYVQPGSVAEKAGIKKLDFLAEINGEDVRSSTHAHTVSLLKNAVGELELVIITVPNINETFLTGVINTRVNYRNEMNKPRNFKFHDHSLGILEPLNESPEEDICEISEKCNAVQLEDQNIVKKNTEIEDDTNFEIVFINDPQMKPVVQPRKFLLKPSNSSQPPKPILPSEFVTKSKSVEVVSPLKEYRRQELSINNIVSAWSVNDVTNFLISLGLLQHVNNFKIGKVDGFKLQQLKRQDFIHLGVDDVTHRMHIERGILKANRTMSSC
ncbi:hypothetical protein HELRODRAFT_158379 [Helobdella robusta]|uniref:PDZ domain-containing protein n=1 Tax=Helobdella robusta TaxID=6412 RepID=T1EMQ6_HELRO|nr:hypothetical protein HELRODRAFT_158379 [Helobdella robusta]ESO11994.1 hypothetical protein HELRODRAFT_158379 [Helobdella robusta]